MNYITGNKDIILLFTMSGLAMMLFLMDGSSIKTSTPWMIWLPYFSVVILEVAFSYKMIFTVKVLLVDVLLWGTMFLYANCHHQDEALPKLIECFSAVFTMSVVIQLVMPEVISLINSKLLPKETYEAVMRGYNSGYYAGITGQVGIVAYFCVICVAFAVSHLLFEERNRLFYVFLICFAILALLLTKKRAHFIGILIVIAVIIVLKQGKKALGTLAAVGFGMLLLLLGMSFIPQTHALFERLISGGLSGRDKIYAILIAKFNEHPFTGIGLGSSSIYLTGHTSASTAHNEYLRSLCETGILGFITLIFALFYNYWHTVRKFRQAVRNKEGEKKALRLWAFSIFMQTFILMYAMTGNPLSDYSQLYMYFICVMLGNTQPLENKRPCNNP